MAGRRRYKLSEQFESKARIETIRQFRRGSFAPWGEDAPKSLGEIKFYPKGGFFPNMPVIFRGDGTTWNVGNTYLLQRLSFTRPWEMATIQDTARSLLIYLKFCEDEQLDPLNMPNDDLEKPTYRYVMALKEHVMNGLGQNTAAKLVGHMIHFYKHLDIYKIVRPEELGARPYRKLTKYVRAIDSLGLVKNLKVDSTDLSISRKPTTKRPGHIKDGYGKQLRPLTEEETLCLNEAIFLGRDKVDGSPPEPNEIPLCNTELSIMIEVLFRVGLRKATMLGLRVAHVLEMYARIDKHDSIVRLHTNRQRNDSGIQIDPKQGRDYEMLFPKRVVKRLHTYVTSEKHQELRKRNDFYGDSEENYVFLTRQGNPYMTSKYETFQRQDPKSDRWVNAPDFRVKSGSSFNTLFDDFVIRLRDAYPQVDNFAPHDLRATCGMQFVRSLRKRGYGEQDIINHVMTVLGHSNPQTTMQYLDFEESQVDKSQVTDAVEEDIFGEMTLPSKVYDLKVLK